MFQWKVIHSVKTFSDIKAFQILKRTRKSNLFKSYRISLPEVTNVLRSDQPRDHRRPPRSLKSSSETKKVFRKMSRLHICQQKIGLLGAHHGTLSLRVACAPVAVHEKAKLVCTATAGRLSWTFVCATSLWHSTISLLVAYMSL